MIDLRSDTVIKTTRRIHATITGDAVYLFLLFVIGSTTIAAQNLREKERCSPPFPAARFYVEPQPDSPLLIRDLRAERGMNPRDPMAYNRIRVTLFFENRSEKKIKHYVWDDPSPNESEVPGGGIDARGLLPGESQRYENIYHTQKGPSVVFRVSEIEFADGTTWKASRYNRRKALRSTPICVISEKWPNVQPKRSITSTGWATPIFADRVRTAIEAEPLAIEGIAVQTKLYEIERERLDAIEACAAGDLLERVIGRDRSFDFDVEKYRSFAVNGKVFAYMITYEFVDEPGQYQIGTGSYSFFADTEGLGRFSLQCDNGNVIPPLPKWLKNSIVTK